MADDPAGAESDGRSPAEEPVLSPAKKSSLLWGLVGGLSFLVLVQGYELLADLAVGFGAKLAVALVVTAGAAALSHVTRDRLPAPDGRE